MGNISYVIVREDPFLGYPEYYCTGQYSNLATDTKVVGWTYKCDPHTDHYIDEGRPIVTALRFNTYIEAVLYAQKNMPEEDVNVEEYIGSS